MLAKTARRPRTRSRPSPVTRFSKLFVDSIPLRLLRTQATKVIDSRFRNSINRLRFSFDGTQTARRLHFTAARTTAVGVCGISVYNMQYPQTSHPPTRTGRFQTYHARRDRWRDHITSESGPGYRRCRCLWRRCWCWPQSLLSAFFTSSAGFFPAFHG